MVRVPRSLQALPGQNGPEGRSVRSAPDRRPLGPGRPGWAGVRLRLEHRLGRRAVLRLLAVDDADVTDERESLGASACKYPDGVS